MNPHQHTSSSSNIKLAFFLNLFFAIFEIAGSFFTSSLAILSTGLHDLGDTLSLGTSWFLLNYSQKQRNQKFSYGYRRFSLLGALINSIVIITGSFFVISEAVRRIQNPVHSDAQGMILFAIIGITVNLVAALRVRKGQSINEKVIVWHLLDDVFGWAAVLVVAVIIIFRDVHVLDPILSGLVSLYVLWKVLKNFRKTVAIFLQAVPESINIKSLEEEMLHIGHIQSIHDTHLWSLDGEYNILTTHILLSKKATREDVFVIKCKVKELVQKENVQHSTIEVEIEGEICKLDGC
ncbi:MAG: cation diffusion facilitator family transporter [Candidatus Gracilibacteria bacterium]